MDKVCAPNTLALAWERVRANRGAAGVDGQSVINFEAKAGTYLTELAEVRTWVEANGLTLHPDKTHVGDCRQKGEGFEFLGYLFESGRRWVRKKSLKRIKDAIRSKTGGRGAGA